MARASAWGLGAALAYRGLDTDAQAELLALWMAARKAEGDEAEMVLIKTIGDLANGWRNARSAEGGAEPAPLPVPTGIPQGAGKGMTERSLPDILRPRMGADALVSFGS